MKIESFEHMEEQYIVCRSNSYLGAKILFFYI